MGPRLGTLLWALGATAIGACSKSIVENNCSDVGVQHEDMVTVVRGSNDYALDVDQCAASGQCDALCYDVRGKPGDGNGVGIISCTLISIDKLDAAAANDGSAQGAADGGIRKDASVIIETSVTLDIKYVVTWCGPQKG